MILMTGATGTVGSEILTRLSAHATAIRAVTRDPRKADAHLLPHGFCRKVRFLGKTQKSGVSDSMTYRLSNSRKSNFATEP